MNSDLYAPTQPLSKTAITQAHRAAKAIAAHFTAHNIPATEGTEPSEHLTEASYAAAEERHIYQSEAQYERWLDWRTLTESIVIDTLASAYMETDSLGVDDAAAEIYTMTR